MRCMCLVRVRLEIFGVCVVATYVFKRSSNANQGRQNSVYFGSGNLIYVGLVTRHNNGLVLQIYCSTVVITAH